MGRWQQCTSSESGGGNGRTCLKDSASMRGTTLVAYKVMVSASALLGYSCFTLQVRRIVSA